MSWRPQFAANMLWERARGNAHKKVGARFKLSCFSLLLFIYSFSFASRRQLDAFYFKNKNRFAVVKTGKLHLQNTVSPNRIGKLYCILCSNGENLIKPLSADTLHYLKQYHGLWLDTSPNLLSGGRNPRRRPTVSRPLFFLLLLDYIYVSLSLWLFYLFWFPDSIKRIDVCHVTRLFGYSIVRHPAFLVRSSVLLFPLALLFRIGLFATCFSFCLLCIR